MELQRTISRINWRQLLVHFIAGLFFIHAFIALSHLYDTRFIVAYRSSYEIAMNTLVAHGVTIYDIMNFTYWVSAAGSIGFLAAFIISMIISIKRGWFWLNPVIVLIATYLINRFIPLGDQLLRPIHPLIKITTNNPIVETAIYGALLLAVGTFIFFYPRLTRFIEKGLPEPVPEQTA